MSEEKTPEQIRAEKVSVIKSLAQEVYSCATNFRNAVEQIDTGFVKGVDIKAIIDTLSTDDVTNAQLKQVRNCAIDLEARYASLKTKLKELAVLP